jgi:hypothetical protein
MVTIFKKALFAAAIVAMATTVSFANDDTNNGDPENGQSQPVGESITVTVLGPGTNCPPQGIVKSDWYYKHPVYPYPEAIKPGTSANYPTVPFTVVLFPIYPDPPYGPFPLRVKVTVIPYGHPEAANSLMVFPPFIPVGITPGTCNGAEPHTLPINSTQ